ncbi:MAG: LPS-assembly protein LptD [Candidatus Hydrogenedens sp.]|jgi:lipopolysaccharide assembly outer membrane protein LptD (OstA)|nr:LPS-assembly protein LptD [Candidatus Hydrogenedens sp.]
MLLRVLGISLALLQPFAAQAAEGGAVRVRDREANLAAWDRAMTALLALRDEAQPALPVDLGEDNTAPLTVASADLAELGESTAVAAEAESFSFVFDDEDFEESLESGLPAATEETIPELESSEEKTAESQAPAEGDKGIEIVQESPEKELSDEEETDAPLFRQQPLRVGELRAPRPGRPSANPLEGMDKRTLRDAITRPVEFGEASLGFEPPDWTEPLRDIEADSMTADLATRETVLKDHVRLRLGEMDFESDSFRFSEQEGHYEAQGNVIVQQHQSRLSADRLSYTAPAREEVEEIFILEPGPDEQGFARKRLTMGRLLAENLHVEEPTRELHAAWVDYDFATQTGELRDAWGTATVFRYEAEKVEIFGPDNAHFENISLTTCFKDPPHYKIHLRKLEIQDRENIRAEKLQLQLGKFKLPFYMPLIQAGANQAMMLDYDSGTRAATGYYINTGVQFDITPELSLGPRIMPTAKQGFGLGADMYYDFMSKPTSPLYRTQGELHGLYTTKDRGHYLWRHRYEDNEDFVLRMESEHWSDRDYFKDFFYEEFRNRTTPRSFAHLLYRQPSYIATATARLNTHSWLNESEQLPEATFHLIERPLTGPLMASFDTVSGYYRQKFRGLEGIRSVSTGRLSLDWNPLPYLGVTPFIESQATWYQHLAYRDSDYFRFNHTAGLTLLTRFHKIYPGLLGFSAIKHVVEPSITYSYTPSTSLRASEVPQMDAYDSVFGRNRVETKLSNLFYGKDAETDEVWRVGRLTLYHGADFWNEVQKSQDYEVEIDIRPRPWWGTQFVLERHDVNGGSRRQNKAQLSTLLGKASNLYGRYNQLSNTYSPYDPDNLFNQQGFSISQLSLPDRSRYDRSEEHKALYTDYTRLLTQVYYDNTLLGGRLSSRVGFAYTDTAGTVFNREILYGLGYKLGEHWGVGFEHIYSLRERDMIRQTYEVRRKFDCWESAVRFRDRGSGFDVNLEVSLVAFPGSRIRF